MENIVLAGILGLAFSALQLFLMQRVIKARSAVMRGMLLLLKMPLWALAFTGIALWWGTGPLLAFGIAAGALYLAAAIVVFVRTHPIHRRSR